MSNGGNIYKIKETTDNVPFINPLPSGYQLVEYIESIWDEKQYIDTGYEVDYNKSYKLVYKVIPHTYTTSSGDYHYFGANAYLQSKMYEEDGWVIDTPCIMDCSYDASKRRTTINNLNCVTLTTTTKTMTWTSSKWTGSHICLLSLGSNQSGAKTAGDWVTGGKLYWARIYEIEDDIEKLVHNYFPCKNISSGKYGVYDKVTNTFLGNSQAGCDFVGGDELKNPNETIYNTLPKNLTRVETIDSTSSTSNKPSGAYIDTGVIPYEKNNYLRIKFKTHFTHLKSSGNYYYNTGGSNWCSFEYLEGENFYFNAGSSTFLLTGSYRTKYPTELDIIYDGNTISKRINNSNEVQSKPFSGTIKPSSSTATLCFGNSEKGGGGYSALRLHYLKIWDKDSSGNIRLIRDYVPCRYPDSNVGMLYDRANNTIIRSAKNPDFTCSNVDWCASIPYYNKNDNHLIYYNEELIKQEGFIFELFSNKKWQNLVNVYNKFIVAYRNENKEFTIKNTSLKIRFINYISSINTWLTQNSTLLSDDSIDLYNTLWKVNEGAQYVTDDDYDIWDIDCYTDCFCGKLYFNGNTARFKYNSSFIDFNKFNNEGSPKTLYFDLRGFDRHSKVIKEWLDKNATQITIPDKLKNKNYYLKDIPYTVRNQKDGDFWFTFFTKDNKVQEKIEKRNYIENTNETKTTTNLGFEGEGDNITVFRRIVKGTESVSEYIKPDWRRMYLQCDFAERKVQDTTTVEKFTRPFCIDYKYSLSQSIYEMYYMGQSGRIHSIAYYIPSSYQSTPPCQYIDDVKIYMGHTTKFNFTSNTDWFPSSSLRLVYEGSLILGKKTDCWEEIKLNSFFEYDITKNLVVAIAKRKSDNDVNCYIGADMNIPNLYRFSNTDSNYANISKTSIAGTLSRSNEYIKFNFLENTNQPKGAITCWLNDNTDRQEPLQGSEWILNKTISNQKKAETDIDFVYDDEVSHVINKKDSTSFDGKFNTYIDYETDGNKVRVYQ